MNICLFTGRIIAPPKKVLYRQKYSTKLSISIPNNKQGASLYNITAIARGRIADDIFNLYRRGDYAIIEGSIRIVNQKDQVDRNKKEIFFDILRLHPAHFI